MRQQSTSSISYFFRNFIFLLPLSIVPAVLLGFSCANKGFHTFIDFFYTVFKQGDSFIGTNFYEGAYKYFSYINFSPKWWLWLVGWVILFVACCLQFSMIEKHMRLGVRRYTGISGYNINVLLNILLYFLLLAVYIECINLIGSAVLFVAYKLGLRGVLLIVLSMVLYVVDLFFILYAYTMTMCAIPSKIMDNYDFNFAMSYSIQLVSTKFWRIFVKVFATFSISLVITSLSKLLYLSYDWYNFVYHGIVMSALFLFWLMMFCIFSFKTYVTLTNGQRRDLSTPLFNRK